MRRVFVFSILLGCVSCATTPQVASVLENPMPEAGAQVVLRPGDTVKLEFLYHPELNQTQTVRPDGKLSLQLVNEVEVEGLTPEGVREKLLGLYGVVLKDPEITVVLDPEGRFVYVGGEVDIPGGQFPIRVPLAGRLTPMEAIMQAGGLKNQSAKISNVLIVRRVGEKQYARTIDLRSAFRNEETEPFFLAPDDIVFVPRTRIDRADQWVDQYMNRLVPDWVNVNLGYAYSRTKSTAGGMDTVTASPAGISVTQTR